MLLNEVAEYLHQQDVGFFDPQGLKGNIFIGVLPDQPETCMALYPTGGQQANSKLGYDMPTFQIITRGSMDMRKGYELSQKAYDALHGFRQGEFIPSGQWIVSCLGLQSGPIHLGPDSKGRHEFSLNYVVDLKRK